jgi:4-amino-4-deoxy-L-arabinose transferase-like glycosyltransferase
MTLALLCGVALGASILTRPFAILVLPPMLGVALWRSWRRDIRSYAATAAFLMAVVATLAPWTIRTARYSVGCVCRDERWEHFLAATMK